MDKSRKPAGRFSAAKAPLSFDLLRQEQDIEGDAPPWGWPEIFIVIQYVSTGLLFIPGTQSFRFLIRALPYLFSGFLLLLYLYKFFKQREQKWKLDASMQASQMEEIPARGKKLRGRQIAKVPFPYHGMQGWLLAALTLMTLVWLFHPNSHFTAGMGQVFFQFLIAAPAFWAVLVVKSRKHLIRLLVLTFATNFVSAGMGVLQVYYPDNFNPPEFTSADPEMIKRLQYEGPGGKMILRPCGLTDTPGGASYAGLFTGFLGLGLALSPGMPVWGRFLCIFGAGLGPLVLLLTQVRSLFIVLAGVTCVFAGIMFLQRRIILVQLILGMGLLIGIGAFVWAINIGGEGVRDRFGFVFGEENYGDLANERNQFWTDTFQRLLPRYPFGAGMGRWGIMQATFNNNPSNFTSEPLYVEVQITGWLFDGGVLLWMLYPLALIWAAAQILKSSIDQRHLEIAYWYAMVFALNLTAVVQSYSQPTFNTQFGILFWFFSGAAIGLIFRQKENQVKALALKLTQKVSRFA